jgi:hypothetical protein
MTYEEAVFVLDVADGLCRLVVVACHLPVVDLTAWLRDE